MSNDFEKIAQAKEKLNSHSPVEEDVQDVLLQEHPDVNLDFDPEQLDVDKIDTISDRQIDQILQDGFQTDDLDKIFPSIDKHVSQRYQSRLDAIKKNLGTSLSKCPDLSKARDLIQQSLAKKSTVWLEEQNRQINEKYEQIKQAKASDSPVKMALVTGLKLSPFAGPLSDISEGVVGQDLYGQKLTRGQQAYKIIEGSIFLAIDATGYGAIATEGVKAGKLITRSAALMRQLKVSPRLYKSIYSAGLFIKRNQHIARLADTMLSTVLVAKQSRQAQGLEDLKPLLGVVDSDHTSIEIANEIPGLQKHIQAFEQKHNLAINQLSKKDHGDKISALIKQIEGGEIG
ncbi:MAG TPA: hypothetical protein PLH65_02270 [bacterium]|nr:hypothetical protein [bacterium]HPN67380.1 hypothetical protein [bacterium]